MARTLEPTFLTVKVTPPVGAVKDTQPLINPATKYQSTSQLQTGINRPGSTSTECTGKDFSAAKHQFTSQLHTGINRPGSTSSERTGKYFSAAKHQSTSQLQTD